MYAKRTDHILDTEGCQDSDPANGTKAEGGRPRLAIHRPQWTRELTFFVIISTPSIYGEEAFTRRRVMHGRQCH